MMVVVLGVVMVIVVLGAAMVAVVHRVVDGVVVFWAC